ncbi:MAG: tyrosine recombinase XerC [Undibacterium umbellatum]|jgi:integrase/recombinase XerC|uniref:tyrosine recombinase XerC n=1 Tax=Undibacterium TaxID=401469 RepID=UPI00272FF295|nr:tyrosine recombinase XerC [Undibacterium sp.]MDP1980066.1 tyrosine recombinase XerC [Undibacterium sp.]
MNTQDQYLANYLEVLRSQRQLSQHTLDSYLLDLHELIKLAGTAELLSLTTHHIRRFAAQMHAGGQNARSIARKLSSWRGFYRWLLEEHDLAANPVEGVRAPKKGKPLPKALGADDAVHLVAHKGGDLPTARANRAMFELLYSSGLRVSELASLDVMAVNESGYSSAGWVDRQEGEVHVTGKGGKQRIVPVGKPALDALQDWLAIRPTLVKADPHPLFLSERGTRISVRLIQLRLKAHAQTLDIPANVHPHMLRHSFASHVLQSSGDLRAVQEMLGHSSISATQVYTSLDFQHLAKVYDQTHPRAKK